MRSAKRRLGTPAFMRLRRYWLLPLCAWLAAVLASLSLQLHEQRQHSLAVATEGARHMFNMIVLVRSWNAGHGGVYVPVTETVQPNPYLLHPRRDLITRDGLALTMVNPAFMTRQIAELAQRGEGVLFHITSLNPIRPQNAADAWERGALNRFENSRLKEYTEIVDTPGRTLLRYMAPLYVKPPCLACHAQQGYREGDLRGGVSISLPYAPIEASVAPARRQAMLSHGLVFVVVAALGWLLLELLRRRWLDHDARVLELQNARIRLEASNRSLARARDAAESAARAKDAFLATMSHELRTPMNGVMGMAELLRETGLDDDQRDYLGTLQGSAEHLMHLLNSMIDYARLDATTCKAVARPFSLRGLIAALAARHQATVRAKGLELDTGQDSTLPDILCGDDGRIYAILDQFLENAIKFTEQGRVSLHAEGAQADAGAWRVRFSVSDTGIGMDDATRDRLFQPFVVADSSTTRRHAGIGMGLALCGKLADILDGHLDVSSQPGRGSTFSLEISLRCADTVAAEITHDDLAHYASLLAGDDMAASALYTRLAPGLSRLLGASHIEFDRHMRAFEYAEALAMLKPHL